MRAAELTRPLDAIAKERVSLLSKEVLPFGGSTSMMRAAGLAVIGNPDPVIAFLSQRGEETYALMERSETAISAARQNVDTTILERGSELCVGESGSPAAETLRDAGVDFLKRIPKFTEVLERMLDPIYRGWRPFELLWRPDRDRSGEVRWFCTSVVEKDNSRFRFTQDRELVLFSSDYRAEPKVLSAPEDWLHWMPLSSGSNDNPYGVAVLQRAWLLWYAKQRFFQLWAQGMERSQGVVVLKQTGPADMSLSYEEAWAAVRTEVQAAIRVLRDANVLVSMPGWDLDLKSDIKFSEGWQSIIDYCDREMSTVVAGETLSFKEAEFGTRAQGQVHETAGGKVAKLRAKKLEGFVNDELLARFWAVNFSGVKAEDLPRWRTKLGREMNLEVARFVLQAGGKLDGTRIAAEGNVPIVMEPRPGTLVLERQVAPTPALPGQAPAAVKPGPAAPKTPPTPPKPGQRAAEDDESDRLAGELDRLAGELDGNAARLVERSAETAGSLFAERLDAIVERYLEAHPDPFA